MKNIYQEFKQFSSQMEKKLSDLNLSLTDYPLDHVGYRAKTKEDYKELLNLFQDNSVLYTTKQHHGRAFHMFVLKEPLEFNEVSIPYIEFAEPGGSDSYERGFQHIEFLTNKTTEEIVTHKSKLKDLLFEGKFGDETYLKWPDKTAVKVTKLALTTKSLLDKEAKIMLTSR